MKFSEQWLREWVNPDLDSEGLAEQLTMAGLEVDSIEPAAPAFQGVVVGEVLSVEPHPQADKLKLCQVDVGAEEPLAIVCGAANVKPGIKVPTAVLGAVLPGNFKIKKAKLRGVTSFGMLCAAQELGLAESSEGLLVLDDAAPVGEDLRRWLQLDDTIIEVDFTPNRGDCLSIAGLARELGALCQSDVHRPDIQPVESDVEDAFEVEIQAPEDCPRYLGRVIRGIDPQASTPLWMQERLRRSGLRSLGPLVDVTNYVLLELGQPMHAFDLDRLQGRVVVRRARNDERLRLLDGATIELDQELLVIADETAPQALAGIMGGADSAVSETTRDVFLECAFFAPDAIRGKGRRFGLQTDSSYRFERGVDFALQHRAMERATALILQIAGGQAGPVIEHCSQAHLPQRRPVLLRRERLRQVLGIEVSDAQVEDALRRLGMALEEDPSGWRATPPSYRYDIAIEVDLIEEIGRIHGYDNIPLALPQGELRTLGRPEARVTPAQIRRLLVDRGYQETINYSFVDPASQALLDPDTPPLALNNPISSEMSVMRTTLWASLLKVLAYNHARQQERIRLFEQGMRFLPADGDVEQQLMVAGAILGSALPKHWSNEGHRADFFDIKSDVEAILGLTRRSAEFIFERAAHPALHPGQCARIRRAGEAVGWLGALHPQVQQTLDLPAGVLVFELEYETLAQGKVPRFSPIAKFPSIRRDLALVVDDEMPAANLRKCLEESLAPVLKELEIFDVYRGKGVPEGKKSLAFALTLQDDEQTLTDDEVEALIQDTLATLKQTTGATLRE